MKIKVKDCCHSSNSTVRYDAGVGDVVLIRRGDGSYVEAKIHAIPSSQSAIVVELGNTAAEKEVSISEIVVLMLGE